MGNKASADGRRLGPGRPPDPQRQRIRRQMYLDAGLALYEAQGYDGLRVADLARLTGLSKRSLYLDFESKDDLFVQIAIEGVTSIVELLGALEIAPGVALSAVAIGRVLGRFYRTRPAQARIVFIELNAERLARATPVRVESLRAQHRELIESLTRRLVQAGASNDRARDGARAAIATTTGVVHLATSGAFQLGPGGASEIEALVAQITHAIAAVDRPAEQR